MAGYEVFGEEERQAINEIFDLNGGVIFAHGFDAMRNGIYRVREFEAAFAKKIGSNYGQAVSSGTAAIKVALQALGAGPGDEVITQAYTFVATVEAIIETGATPIIVDINDTLNMDPEAFEAAITKKTKVVVPVHMMGEGADMDPIMKIAQKNNIFVMEDAAQALGASYKGSRLGTIGDVGAFSTDSGKTLNTGEGGVILTNNQKIYHRARGFHDHGHEYSDELGRGEEGAICSGFNYRMTEIHGAIGLAQLKKLDMIIKCQRSNKAKLMEGLTSLKLPFRNSLDPKGDIGDTIVFFMPDRDSTSRFVAKMRDKGLGTKNLPDAIRWHFSKHWQHLLKNHPIYRGNLDDVWQKSADILECSVALPVGVLMEDQKIENIITTLKSF